MTWLAGAIAAIGAAIATVLVAPVHVDVDADTRRAVRVRTRVRWLAFGWDSSRPRRPRRARPASSRSTRPPQSRSGARVSAMLSTPGFIRRLLRLADELVRLARPRTARARVRFGVDDPASTGEIFGAVLALLHVRPLSSFEISVEPDFSGEAFEGEGALAWSVRPGAVLWPACTFLCSPVTWRAIRAARASISPRRDRGTDSSPTAPQIHSAPQA